MNKLAAIGSRNRILSAVIVGLSCLLAFCPMPAHGQQGDMQQKMADLKGSMAKSKQALAQYTWKEQVIISLKGEQKKIQNFQVRMGSDGKPQKTSLDQPQQQSQDSAGRGGRFKQRVVAKKKEEYEELCRADESSGPTIYPAGQRCDSGRLCQGQRLIHAQRGFAQRSKNRHSELRQARRFHDDFFQQGTEAD
jgi:hypothetical protein